MVMNPKYLADQTPQSSFDKVIGSLLVVSIWPPFIREFSPFGRGTTLHFPGLSTALMEAKEKEDGNQICEASAW